MDDEALLATAGDWLLPYLEGMMRKGDLARLDMLQMLQGLVPGELLRRMDKLAPLRMTVPGGGSLPHRL